MQSYYNSSSEIVFYQDKNIIITEVYTIVFDSSNTSTIRVSYKSGMRGLGPCGGGAVPSTLTISFLGFNQKIS